MPNRNLADEIAGSLLADLKAGKIAKIGIDEIHDACEAATDGRLSHRDLGSLTSLTVRRVVEKV